MESQDLIELKKYCRKQILWWNESGTRIMHEGAISALSNVIKEIDKFQECQEPENDAMRQLRVRIHNGQVKEFKDIPHQEKVIRIILGWMNDLRDGKRITKPLKPTWKVREKRGKLLCDHAKSDGTCGLEDFCRYKIDGIYDYERDEMKIPNRCGK